MGKFTRALLLNAKGSVQVELEKKTPYAAGETIAGTVFVTVWEPIAAEGAVRAKLQYNAASRLSITSVLLSVFSAGCAALGPRESGVGRPQTEGQGETTRVRTARRKGTRCSVRTERETRSDK